MSKFQESIWSFRNKRKDFFERGKETNVGKLLLAISRPFKKINKAWLYLLPALILMGVFMFYPIFNTIVLAFKEGYNSNSGDWQSIGFENFYKALYGPDGEIHDNFSRALTNTFVIVFISVPITVVLSLLIAVSLKNILKFSKTFQTIFFLPYVTNAIAIGMVFSLMFHQKDGIVNSFLANFGIDDPINWKGPGASILTQYVVLIAYTIWNGLAFKILIFLSGLMSIDKQYYDAAKIDSTPRWRVFRRITIPLLSPMIAYVTITSFIGAFKSYSSVVGIFGVKSATEGDMVTLVGLIYSFISQANRYARGAAVSIVLLIIILIFTAINLYVSKKKVHY